MQITLNIDDEVLLTVQSLARKQGRTVGEVVNDLIDAGLGERLKGEVSASETDGEDLLPYP